ncbi:4Fe-4S dicluster domain-containing protein [Anaerolineales bacterium HSG25]|nr:4Fe-4S dicluster domain-containing protein [Anaerolineales bacterium HSG25]
MMSSTPNVGEHVIVKRADFEQLLDALNARNYQIVGPTVQEKAIVYDEITSVNDLPIGWTDEQDKGRYRLKRRADEALFGYVISPQSWKKFLHPASLRLWQAEQTDDGFHITETAPTAPQYAFIGVRACELNAILIQDRVFMHDTYVDPNYQSRRTEAFIMAVNCGQAGNTCFCSSMNAGPKVSAGFDLALTEIIEPDRHEFVVEIGTELGAEVMGEVAYQTASQAVQEQAEQIVTEVASQMGRLLDTTDIKALMYRNFEHPEWENIGNRCLTCANCTMVCPTCFCTTVEDVTDLTGQQAERHRYWDSCFNMEFSYIHGGSVRSSNKARYRQWMTHKLATWVDQFGTLGCVGCGRCITWCPVGIDITEEVATIRKTDSALLTRLREK